MLVCFLLVRILTTYYPFYSRQNSVLQQLTRVQKVKIYQMSTNSTDFLNNSNSEPSGAGNFFEPVYDGCLIVLCMAVIFINLSVLLLYAKRRQLQTKTNTLLVSLAVSDLLMGLCGIPLYIACNAVRQESVCIAQAVVFRFSAVSTMFHILAITGERYFSVIHPLQYISIVTGQRILRVIACVWMVSLFVALVQLSWVVSFGFFSDHSTKFTAALVYNCIGFGLCFAIPFLLMVVVYIQMFITIHRQVQQIRKQSINLDSSSSRFRACHTQLRALFIFALMLGMFAGSWVTWYVSIFQVYASFSFLSEVSMMVFDFLRLGVSFINPLLYTFLKNDFREALMSFLRCKRADIDISASQTSGTTSHWKQHSSIL